MLVGTLPWVNITLFKPATKLTTGITVFRAQPTAQGTPSPKKILAQCGSTIDLSSSLWFGPEHWRPKRYKKLSTKCFNSPNDQISALASYADCLMTSGAIQNGVPTKVFLLLVVFVSWPATPKSANLTSPLLLRRTFAAERRWRQNEGSGSFPDLGKWYIFVLKNSNKKCAAKNWCRALIKVWK